MSDARVLNITTSSRHKGVLTSPVLRVPAEPHHVDRHVGRRMKMRRLLLGLSQERLGELLGLTFQQIQKYERGANRLGASRLYEAARALEVEVGFFFEELLHPPSGLAEDAAPYYAPPSTYIPEGSAPQLVGGRDTLELVRAFERIADDELRRRLLEVTRALADLDQHAPGDA